MNMICADIHIHTRISHGVATVKQMYKTACEKNLKYIGFSEHSPLPEGFSCSLYTGNLEKEFPAYAEEILAMKARDLTGPTLLLGLELDWLPSRLSFMRELIQSYPFDYVIGSLHYLDGYSVGNIKNWPDTLSEEEYFARFAAYFYEMGAMCQSGLINVAAHPDFIKLRSFPVFQRWLKISASKDCITFALEKMAKYNVAMEVNAAGFRWDFQEPYPSPSIMRLAKELNVPISFGSDAHKPEDIAGNFEQLKNYAASFGYSHSLIFIGGEPLKIVF